MRLTESPDVDEPESNEEFDELDELAEYLDPDELEERIAGFDPDELTYAYRVPSPPRRQQHSPWIIVASVLGVVLGLAIWVGVLSAVAGNVSGYIGTSVETLAPQLPDAGAVATPLSCATAPCDTAGGAGSLPSVRTSACANVNGTSAVLARAGIWFVTGCSGG